MKHIATLTMTGIGPLTATEHGNLHALNLYLNSRGFQGFGYPLEALAAKPGAVWLARVEASWYFFSEEDYVALAVFCRGQPWEDAASADLSIRGEYLRRILMGF